MSLKSKFFNKRDLLIVTKSKKVPPKTIHEPLHASVANYNFKSHVNIFLKPAKYHMFIMSCHNNFCKKILCSKLNITMKNVQLHNKLKIINVVCVLKLAACQKVLSWPSQSLILHISNILNTPNVHTNFLKNNIFYL